MATQEHHMAELRSEIKAWEKKHLQAHGKKPTRKDIAADSDIAAKYKEYENLRATMSGRSPPHASRKRKSEDHPPSTPSKRASADFATPRKEPSRERTEDDYVENTPQRARPLMLGPTPQKNGIFVGMFDAISVQTPTHRRSALAEVDDNLVHTPSNLASTPSSRDSKLQKTPMSEGTRFYLDQYMTPRKPKGHDKTPSSISKKYLTPAFFKKYREAALDLPGEEASEPRRAPWKRPKFMRTLSSMINDLKKDEEIVEEDEAFDEEMMVLREIEEEEEEEEEENLGNASLQGRKTDGEPLESAAMDRDGFVASDIREDPIPQDKAEESAKQPSRAFKKKGQKRQTRRVKIRPTRTAAKTLVGETLDDTDEKESNTGDDQAGAEAGVETSEPAKGKNTEAKGGDKDGSQAGRRKKTKDHANYCRLKIKNKNSKAKDRGFGRRR